MADAFQTFTEQFAVYGYPVLFAGVLLENAGVPVPGETAVLVAGFLSSPAGGGHFHIGWVILLTVVAAVIGDNLGFWLGHRWARPRLQAGRGFLFLTPKTLQMAEGYFARYGLWTIFFARFVTGLRVIGALAAGTAGMGWPRFLVANAAGAVAWATTMALLGYFFGHSWEILHHWLGRGGLIILGCVIVLVGLPHLMHRLHNFPALRLERLAPAQIWQGLLAALLVVVCLAVLVVQAQGRHETVLDNRVKEWLIEQEVPVADAVARIGSIVGGLPVVVGVTVVGLLLQWYYGRPGREQFVLLWALLASEGVGLLLVGLLRFRAVEPVGTTVWPFGFAGLIPLRACAVLGTGAYLITRENRALGRWLVALAAVLSLLAGFSVVWSREQLLTETLLEYVAGSLVLFVGMWWLEGYGRGVLPFSLETPVVREQE